MSRAPERTCFLYVRLAGESDSDWRHMDADSVWANCDMETGVECVRNEPLRRFISAAARGGKKVELKIVSRGRERIKTMLVSQHVFRGSKAPQPWLMRFAFRSLVRPEPITITHQSLGL